MYYDDSTLVSFLCMFLFSGLEQRQINSVYNGLAFNIYRVDFVFSLIRSATWISDVLRLIVPMVEPVWFLLYSLLLRMHVHAHVYYYTIPCIAIYMFWFVHSSCLFYIYILFFTVHHGTNEYMIFEDPM